MRLYLVDVNDFQTFVNHPEKIMKLQRPWLVPNFMWELDSHPGMWVNGDHVVRWWFDKESE